MPSIISLLSALASVVAFANAFPQGGAPVCVYADTQSAQMTNVHGTGMAPQATMQVTPMGASYQVALTGITSYNGLILWVRDVAGSQHVGTFDMAGLANIGLRGKDCTAMSGASSGANSTLGHFMANAKTQLTFTWTPDAAVTAGMQLAAEAVVVGANKKTWYTAVPGMFVATVGGAAPAAPAAAPTTAAAAPVVEPITTKSRPGATTVATAAPVASAVPIDPAATAVVASPSVAAVSVTLPPVATGTTTLSPKQAKEAAEKAAKASKKAAKASKNAAKKAKATTVAVAPAATTVAAAQNLQGGKIKIPSPW
ncbi:hypothetical protein HDU93_009767 [Gonapodya sp. JEL0774]|nr:hypothetical protein HDU93_009767 [Gonapodya sp. JEL0774]